MNIFAQLIDRIIKAQEAVVGPIAFEQAKKVSGLTVDESLHTVKINGNEKEAIDTLIKQYEGLFGRASVEVCRDAVKTLTAGMPKEQVPSLLS
jgi:hypothetical protein